MNFFFHVDIFGGFLLDLLVFVGESFPIRLHKIIWKVTHTPTVKSVGSQTTTPSAHHNLFERHFYLPFIFYCLHRWRFENALLLHFILCVEKIFRFLSPLLIIVSWIIYWTNKSLVSMAAKSRFFDDMHPRSFPTEKKQFGKVIRVIRDFRGRCR